MNKIFIVLLISFLFACSGGGESLPKLEITRYAVDNTYYSYTDLHDFYEGQKEFYAAKGEQTRLIVYLYNEVTIAKVFARYYKCTGLSTAGELRQQDVDYGPLTNKDSEQWTYQNIVQIFEADCYTMELWVETAAGRQSEVLTIDLDVVE